MKTQNPCSASPAVAACLNVRSSGQTFTPANQPEVTHQAHRASRAHPLEMRTGTILRSTCVRAHHPHGRDDFHGVPDISLYATRHQKCRSSSRPEPAIPFPFPEVLYPTPISLPGEIEFRTVSSFIPHNSSFPFHPSPNPPGTAIFGFVRVKKEELSFLSSSPDFRASSIQARSAQPSKLALRNQKSAMPPVYKFSAQKSPIFRFFPRENKNFPNQPHNSLANPKSRSSPRRLTPPARVRAGAFAPSRLTKFWISGGECSLGGGGG